MWHYIFWTEQQWVFAVAKEDRIGKPILFGLGTKSAPFGVREEAEEESDRPETQKGSEEGESAEATPIVSRKESEVFDRLALQLETTSIVPQPYLDDPTAHTGFDDNPVAELLKTMSATETQTIARSATGA